MTFSRYMPSVYLTLLLVIAGNKAFCQDPISDATGKAPFNWAKDSVPGFYIYYLMDSWTEENMQSIRQMLPEMKIAVESFMDIPQYPDIIHIYILNTRLQMKELIGYETNGSAFPNLNAYTCIGSEGIKSVFSNHELFHVMAMNSWGKPDLWINEGMAVYSSGRWFGHELHSLAHYLKDSNRFIPLKTLIRDFKKTDDRLSYPLAGSFSKFLDETYGREVVLSIWKGNKKALESRTGKSLKELEEEWIGVVEKSDYGDLKY